MGGVRARKSRRTKFVNNTRASHKRRKGQLKVPAITSKVVKEHWNAKKTLKQNFKNIGLAFDPNNACQTTSCKVRKIDKSKDNAMECEETSVVEKLMEESSMTSKKERFISRGEAQFILSLKNDYGENYKAMAKDKRNYQQHTPNQLRRKFESFFKSSYFPKYT